MVAEWSVGLFDCLDDFDICCLTCWCPCVTFGRIAEIADKGSTSCCVSGTLYVCLSLLCCHWLYSFPKRSAMRSQYNLQEWPFMDWYVHLHYPSCALCQKYRELENRGFNMAKGWKGSNKFVVCVHGMKAPVKQAMCF